MRLGLLSHGIHAALCADQFAVNAEHKLSSCPRETQVILGRGHSPKMSELN